MTEILRVVHDGRPCFWLPVRKDNFPVEGKGVFVGPSSHSSCSIAIKVQWEDGSTSNWLGFSEENAKGLMRMMAEGLREFDSVTHVPEKK